VARALGAGRAAALDRSARRLVGARAAAARRARDLRGDRGHGGGPPCRRRRHRRRDRPADWKGVDTLDWAIHQHGILATLLGLGAVGCWFLLRARRATQMTQNAMTAVCVLLACQGFVGTAQYAMELPPGMVWIHVVLAALTWIALLWAAVAVGRAEPTLPVPPAPVGDAEPPLVRS
jgi:heme A synthase